MCDESSTKEFSYLVNMFADQIFCISVLFLVLFLSLEANSRVAIFPYVPFPSTNAAR